MPTREEMIREIKRAQMIKEIRAAEAAKPSPEMLQAEQEYAALTPGEQKTLGVAAGARQFRESIPILGAGIAKLEGLAKPYLPEAIQKDIRLLEYAQGKLQKESPKLATGLELGAAFINPVPVAGAISQATKLPGALARIGESAAVLGADTALRGGDVSGAVTAGAIGGVAGEALGGAVGKFAKLPESLKAFAEQRAVKAAIGQNAAALKKMGDIENIQKFGRELLTADQAGAPAVKAFTNVEEAADAAAAKKELWGGRIGLISDMVDNVKPQAVSGANIAQKIRDYAGEIKAVGKGAGLKERLEQEAMNFDKLGNMSVKDAMIAKNQFKFDPQTPDLLVSDKDVINKINRFVSNEMDETIEAVGNKSLRSEYAKAKEKYGIYKTITDAAEKREKQNIANRFISPSDYAVGGLGFLGAALDGNDSRVQDAIIAVGAGLGNKFARTRGSAFAAKSADVARNLIGSSPEALGKYYEILSKAAARGNPALTATHFILLQNEKEYRDKISNITEPKKQESSAQIPAPNIYGKYAKTFESAKERGGNAVAATNFILSQTDPEYRKKTLAKGSESK